MSGKSHARDAKKNSLWDCFMNNSTNFLFLYLFFSYVGLHFDMQEKD